LYYFFVYAGSSQQLQKSCTVESIAEDTSSARDALNITENTSSTRDALNITEDTSSAHDALYITEDISALQTLSPGLLLLFCIVDLTRALEYYNTRVIKHSNFDHQLFTAHCLSRLYCIVSLALFA
jgi:hypothetical protein